MPIISKGAHSQTSGLGLSDGLRFTLSRRTTSILLRTASRRIRTLVSATSSAMTYLGRDLGKIEKLRILLRWSSLSASTKSMRRASVTSKCRRWLRCVKHASVVVVAHNHATSRIPLQRLVSSHRGLRSRATWKLTGSWHGDSSLFLRLHLHKLIRKSNRKYRFKQRKLQLRAGLNFRYHRRQSCIITRCGVGG